MAPNVFMLGVLAIVVATTVSCSASQSTATVTRQPEDKSATVTEIEVSIDGFAASPHISRTIEINQPRVLQISLYSNATTGYAWSEASISEPGLLRQESRLYPPPSTSLVGAGGQDVWRFRTAGQGQTTVSMEYRQPWQGGETAWTFEIAVSVR